MVGYASSAPGSQRVPAGLPVKIRDRGDFLGLLANRFSIELLISVLRHTATYTPRLPVTGLKVRLGLEKHFPGLARRDHAPFWAKEIPALMWTDTSEFRNFNYHLRSDTPDTLAEAPELGLTELYLWTPSAESLYARHGWKVFERLSYHGLQICIMHCHLLS